MGVGKLFGKTYKLGGQRDHKSSFASEIRNIQERYRQGRTRTDYMDILFFGVLRIFPQNQPLFSGQGKKKRGELGTNRCPKAAPRTSVSSPIPFLHFLACQSNHPKTETWVRHCVGIPGGQRRTIHQRFTECQQQRLYVYRGGIEALETGGRKAGAYPQNPRRGKAVPPPPPNCIGRVGAVRVKLSSFWWLCATTPSTCARKQHEMVSFLLCSRKQLVLAGVPFFLGFSFENSAAGHHQADRRVNFKYRVTSENPLLPRHPSRPHVPCSHIGSQ